ncbi:DUF3048 domain-containing protein [Demequina sp.]|uniref:DUF3048 domain-containing protein n=1 Tax=Demequina sp. TaxID=2050685 RepID=UPI003A89D059
MRTQRLAPWSALAVAAALALSACASTAVESDPATTLSIAPSAERTSAPAAPEDPRPEVVWPLTGEDATGANEADLARPALSIKIENSSAARPQSNLQHADVVFEEQVEYGISRFVAIFHSDVPETVGPIRSMRPMDKNIMGSFGGPLIFSGAQSRFISGTTSTGQEVIAQDTGDYGFYRTSDKAAPHNLHGRTADFFAQTDADAPDQQWEYAYPAQDSTIVADGETATTVDMNISPQMQPEWRWDSDASEWMRYEGGSPHVTDDGTQLSTTNIVILWTKLQETGRGAGGGSVPETIVVRDSGTGWAVSGNRYIPINWSKAGQFDPFVFTTTDGEPVTFMPGKTWVELVPESGGAGKGSVEIS